MRKKVQYNKVQRYIAQPNLARVVAPSGSIFKTSVTVFHYTDRPQAGGNSKTEYQCELGNIYSEESQQDLSSAQMIVKLTLINVLDLQLID